MAKYHGRLEEVPGNFRKKAFAASRGPGADERARLEARRTELRRHLAPGGNANAAAAAKLLASQSSFGVDARATAHSIQTVLQVIGKHPTWAIDLAVDRFRNGTAVTRWDRNRAPSEAQLCDEVRAITADDDEELRRIDDILGAEVYKPMSREDRAKLDEAVSGWLAGRRLSQRAPAPETDEQFDARLRATGSLEGMRLSDEAVRGFRERQAERA